uniref:PB1 domain-containing protein n=1 Tax=Salarias fasciatus TaxID=181472 RepID=A0A672GEJ9_SALFA
MMMSTANKFLLRVYLSTDVAVKVTLSERPKSVEELINILREKVKEKLDFEFTLQYEDPDFDGQLSCLVDIKELPEKGTLRVVRSESDASSCASSDTDILPHVPVSNRQKTWPDVFPVPTFSYEVEHVLAEGNDVFQRSGKTVKLNRAQKHNILETMAAAMHAYKAYPSDRDVGAAAEALVRTHPCLKELGSVSGWYGWKVSLKFKMGNYCTKLARSGCLEVSINSGKRSRNNPDKESPHSNIKRARRAEVNFLPDFPRGENQASLEEMRLQIVQEVAKSEKNKVFIEKLMQTTFALRRQEIVQENPPVKDILERWPALQMETQVKQFASVCNFFPLY